MGILDQIYLTKKWIWARCSSRFNDKGNKKRAFYAFGDNLVHFYYRYVFSCFAERNFMDPVGFFAEFVERAPEWLLKRFDAIGPDGRYRLKRLVPTVLVSVLVTAAVCTTIDFTCGMICNRNYEVWDYREIPFNFMGQVCLQNSTVYTIAASLILWVFYPLMDRALRRMPRFASDGLFFALLGIYAFSALLHFMYVDATGLVIGAFEM